MASKSSMVTSSSGFGRLVPALLTRMLKGLGAGDGLLHGGEVGDVEHQRVGLLAASADACGGRLDLGFGAGGQRDMRAGIGECPGGGEADAAAGARDERALAVEAEGGGGGELGHVSALPAVLWDHGGIIAEQRHAGISRRAAKPGQ